MYRSQFAVQADEYAALAASAKTFDERDLYLSMEKLWRHFAHAAARIRAVRERNKLSPLPSRG